MKGQWEGNLVREYDLVAIDSQEMVVETNSYLKNGHVDDFLKQIIHFKKFWPKCKYLKV